MIFTGAFAALVPGEVVGEMTSIGTLLAFVLVCIGVMVLRKTKPNLHRAFRCPGSPVIPVLGIIVCFLMMCSLGHETWIRLVVWLAIGMIVYFFYGSKHSKLRQKK
jgi:APA family basic amino acid/polyamine antiporter